MNKEEVIARLQLEPHVEGGFFRRTYQSEFEIQVNRQSRSVNTAIYYLLDSDDFSCWHRLKADEIWHYYGGSCLIVYQLDSHGNLITTTLGNLLDCPDAVPQCIIPAGNWFAAAVASPKSFCLLGCTVAPGFVYDDFEVGDKDEMLKCYPQHENIILRFIREQAD